jgi:UDP-N-acetylenolpyruvoylglucosamine reductase
MSSPDPPDGVQSEFALARLTTVGTGGPAEWFARAGNEHALLELLRWSAQRRVAVWVVGSGSNLLVADDGVRGLVLKLDRELARIDVQGTRIVCGAGARLPALATRAARAGLTGLEFGVNIPGTVGGAVRMNANAYGGQLAATLEWVDVVTATCASEADATTNDRATTTGRGDATARIARREPRELGFSYRASNLRDGEIVVRSSFVLQEADASSVKATLADMRSRRHEAQPQGIKTFGSTFKNPTDARAQGRTAGRLLADAGCNGLSVGGARFAPKHANFIENTGSATTADIVSLMAEGRRRVCERLGVELEPEAQTLGDVRFPW